MLKSYRWGGWVGGPWDFIVIPSPFGLDFGTLDFGTTGLGLDNCGTFSSNTFLSRTKYLTSDLNSLSVSLAKKKM